MVRSTRHTFVVTGSEMLASLRDSLECDENVAVMDGTDCARTLQVLHERMPKVIAVDRCFLETRYGHEFVTRVRDASALQGIDLRVFSPLHVRKPNGVSARAMIAAASQPLPVGLSRRVPRVPMADHVAAVVNGSSLVVVDLSVLGAQVISPGVLRPNQQVAIRLLQNANELRLRAAIAWSAFEQSRITGEPHYRAGLEFLVADPQALERYCRENQRAAEALLANG
jgi:hypothetical protein